LLETFKTHNAFEVLFNLKFQSYMDTKYHSQTPPLHNLTRSPYIWVYVGSHVYVTVPPGARDDTSYCALGMISGRVQWRSRSKHEKRYTYTHMYGDLVRLCNGGVWGGILPTCSSMYSVGFFLYWTLLLPCPSFSYFVYENVGMHVIFPWQHNLLFSFNVCWKHLLNITYRGVQDRKYKVP
jgi:hypothetical protein